MAIATFPLAAAPRPRAFLRVAGPDAEDLLQRLLSNDVATLAAGGSCEALLLTPKARVVATLRVLRRAPDDFLLLTEPELGETVRAHLLRLRLRARAEVEPEEHEALVLLGEEARPSEGALALPTTDYGVPGFEALDVPAPAAARALAEEELEALRIRARTPRFGREIDDRVLPAEAGLERAVSFTKGCYPGQEPVARLHYRGHANRGLRTLLLDGERLPAADEEVLLAERSVGRVTSAVRTAEGVLALAYVRVEVPVDADLRVGRAAARQLH